jgi:hypothetical protein
LQLCFDDLFVGSSQPFYKGLGLRVQVGLITYSSTRPVTIPLDRLFPYTNYILLIFRCFWALIFMGFSQIWTRGTNNMGPNRRTHVSSPRGSIRIVDSSQISKHHLMSSTIPTRYFECVKLPFLFEFIMILVNEYDASDGSRTS